MLQYLLRVQQFCASDSVIQERKIVQEWLAPTNVSSEPSTHAFFLKFRTPAKLPWCFAQIWLRNMHNRWVTLTLLPTVALAQFGNAQVQWDSSANPNVIVSNHEPLKEFKASKGTRSTGLAALSLDELSAIQAGLGVGDCPLCTTRGHYISSIRHGCLDLGAKAVKAQLVKRGLRCEGCTTREQYLDKLLDAVHLPMKQRAAASGASSSPASG